jgi:hypothetical protein
VYDCRHPVNERIADIAERNWELSATAVHNSGYTGRRTTAKAPEIVEKAKTIKERNA